MKNADLEKLYLQHGKMIYGFLLKITYNPTVAEELTQETFYQAFLSLDRYRGECKVTTWLCQIAKNVWFHYQKKEKHLEYIDGFFEDNNAWNCNKQIVNNDPADYVIEKEQKTAFYKALQKIPQDMRDVVYLKISGEFTFAEIGEILGRSEVWARTNYYRGKQIIMKEVHEHEN